MRDFEDLGHDDVPDPLTRALMFAAGQNPYATEPEPEATYFGAVEMTSGRPDWHDYFLGIAKAVAARADCRRAQHGAVIVDREHRIISTGYNGSPPGGPSCLAGECPRGMLTAEQQAHLTPDYSNCIALHAEMNAIAYAGRDTRGAAIYITGPPCDMCSKLIRAAGITQVFYGTYRIGEEQ